ncbi:MAG: exopolysaccharide biosynthesis protein [Verrucomicrobia bacterium]|nr:exopolysaccharide biosynthesis protein [Verrucomicrobiota bacterium]
MILQQLHDQVPAGALTLQWLLERLGQQSFGILMLILAIAAAAPGISVIAGVLLLVTSFEMMIGLPQLRLPNWLAGRKFPTQHVSAVMRRVIPIIAHLERSIHPRLPTPATGTRRVVGVAVFALTMRLLLAPLPLSNIVPAILVALISLAYVEEDGLLLLIALLIGCLFLIVETSATWQLIQGLRIP